MKRPLSLLIAGVACCLLAACSPTKDPSCYLLQSSAAPISASRMPNAVIAVSKVHAPEYLEGKEIVIRNEGGHALTFARTHIWGEPLPRGVQRVLSEELAGPMLAHGLSVLLGHGPRLPLDYSISVGLVRFDALANGKVSLQAFWTLVNEEDGKVLARGSFARSKDAGISGASDNEMFSRIAAAQSELLQAFAKEIARGVQGVIPARGK